MQNPIRPQDLQAMTAHAERDYPNESCGVILGSPGEPDKNIVRPCRNIQEEMRKRHPETFTRGADTGYFMDPKDLRDAFKEASEKGLQITGFYHSHPDHDAYWSQADHNAAMWEGMDEPSYPEAFHVVVSVYNGAYKGYSLFAWDQEQRLFTSRFSGP